MAYVPFRKPDVRAVPVFIYGLTDPDGTIRYVGKSQKPTSRFKDHVVAPYTAIGVRRWIDSLRARDEFPRLKILETVPPGGDSSAAELKHIRALEHDGLLNVHGRRERFRHCRFCGGTTSHGSTGRPDCAKRKVA